STRMVLTADISECEHRSRCGFRDRDERGRFTVVSTPNIGGIEVTPAAGSSFYEKLNTHWHERALQFFMFIVLAHWGEHLVQAYQIYVMGWLRPQANGILGLWYPWLIQS